MKKDEFNPNGAAQLGTGIFGLPYLLDDSKIVLLPVPWDVTASFRAGSANAPKAILNTSRYQELFDENLGSIYAHGLFMPPEEQRIKKKNMIARKLASPIIKNAGTNLTKKEVEHIKQVNSICEYMNYFVYNKVKEYLNKRKYVGVIGGDHSVSLGSIKAHTERYPNMAVLQIDAHADLRKSFEGFQYSHASVMFNVLKKTKLSKLIQVGLRGICEEEYKLIKSSQRIRAIFQSEIDNKKLSGVSWKNICTNIVKELPKEVYISLDVDGLNHTLCPNTGTPEPGGLKFEEFIYLCHSIVKSKRKIVGFDVVEVATKKDSWDAIVAANLIYKLSGFVGVSNSRKATQ